MNANEKIISWLMVAVMVMGGSSTDLYLSSLPKMTELFGTSPDVVNLTLSMFALGMAFGCLFSGFFSDRFGRRPVVLAGVCGFAICALLITVSPSIWLVVALRLFQGLFMSCAFIVCWQLATEVFEGPKQISAVGKMIIGLSVSPAVAPVVGAWLAHFSSWRACFAVSAGIAAVTWLLLLKYLPETLESPLPVPSAAGMLRIFSGFFTVRAFVCYALITTTCYGAYFAFITMSSYIYIDVYGMHSRHFAALFMLLSGASFLGNWLLRKFGDAGVEKRQIVQYGIALSIIGSLVNFGVFLPAPALLCIVIITAGVALTRTGYGMLAGAAQVIAITSVGARGGSATGILFFMQFTACSLSGVVVSSFQSYPAGATVIIAAILIALAAPLFWLAGRERA